MSKLTCQSETLEFSETLSGLLASTTYYIKAFATNQMGTGYGDEISFTTYISCPSSISDADNNTYNIIAIGTQCWMKENLKTTKYSDNSSIPNITNETTWTSLTSGAYIDYNNSPQISSTYGRFYNGYAATDYRNICPTGWHVPSNSDWLLLVNFFGNDAFTAGKLKETGTAHWNSPNSDATNESGFTALPSGSFYLNYSGFSEMGNMAFWWTSDYAANIGIYLKIDNTSNNITMEIPSDRFGGLSVRCLKN